MRAAKCERLRERLSQLDHVERLGRCEQGYVGQVFDARIRPWSRHRVRVKLLREVGLDGIELQFRRLDSRET